MPAKVDRASRQKEIVDALKPVNGSTSLARHLNYTRHMHPAEVRARVKIIRETKIDRGLTSLLGADRKSFLGMIERHVAQDKYGTLSPSQQGVFEFLRRNNVCKETAMRLANAPYANIKEYEKRLSRLRQSISIRRFGVGKIPENFFDFFIGLSLKYMGPKLNATVLKDLENANAMRILTQIMPYWRNVRQIKGRLEPRTILAKVVFLLENGIDLRGRYIRQYSLGELKRRKKELAKIDPQLQQRLLKKLEISQKTGFDPEITESVIEIILRKLEKEQNSNGLKKK